VKAVAAAPKSTPVPAQPEHTTAPAESAASVTSVKAALPSASAAPAATVVQAAEPAPPGFTADPALAERWDTLVRQVCADGGAQALVRELAVQSGLAAVDEATQPPTWRLLVEREMLRNPALQDKLRAALAAALGHEIQLDVAAGSPTDTPARRDAAERQRRQAEAEAVIHGDPLVQQLLAQYKTARIVPGSIKPVTVSSATPTPTEQGPQP
jgi:DNA polymerase-3 subunit gamma/tau